MSGPELSGEARAIIVGLVDVLDRINTSAELERCPFCRFGSRHEKSCILVVRLNEADRFLYDY